MSTVQTQSSREPPDLEVGTLLTADDLSVDAVRDIDRYSSRFMWVDKRGNWHQLYEGMPMPGAHAWSADGISWSNIRCETKRSFYSMSFIVMNVIVYKDRLGTKIRRSETEAPVFAQRCQR